MTSKRVRDKQLVYAASKPKRGTKFQIYSNGEIIIEGMGSQYGINVPSRLRDWIEPQTSKEEWKSKLSITLKIGKGTKHCILKNLLSKLIVKQNRWSLLPNNTQCFGTNLYELLSERAAVTCTFMLPKILWSKKLKQAIHLIKSFSPAKDTKLSTIVAGGMATGSYEILQDALGQLIIKLNVSMGESGDVQLPAELAEIFEGWAITKEQFLCFCEDEQPIIGSTVLINSTSRPERVRKVLRIPYNGPRKRVELLLFNSNIKLTSQMQKDWEIKEQLVTAGCNITSLKSYSKSGTPHWNRSLEQKYQQFLTKVFKNEVTNISLSEVKITSSLQQDINSLSNSYTFDYFIFLPAINNSQPLVLLCEFKTALGKGKTVIITEAIANIRHIHQQIGKTITIPVLLLCDDLKVGNQIITKMYGNYCGVLLIGPKELADFNEEPSLFLNRIEQYQQTQKILQNKCDWIAHPHTGETISRNNLEAEAFSFLLNEGNEQRLTYEWKRKYCSLMGIRLYDFHILYKFFQNEYSSNRNPAISPYRSLVNVIQTRKEALMQMHQFLSKHKSMAIIEMLDKIKTNELFKKILKQKDIILTTFPSDVVVLGQKLTNNKGIVFEQEIQNLLEKACFSVVNNLWCYYRGRKFEVDLVGFKENRITIISCKDLSTYRNWNQLVVIIKTAANKLKYRKELMNAHFAKLFIRPDSKYKPRLQQKFDTKTWCKNVEIVFCS